MGLIQNIDIAIQPYLADGRLVRVLRDWTHTQAGFYLYTPTREQMPAKVRAFLDFLVEKRAALQKQHRPESAPMDDMAAFQRTMKSVTPLKHDARVEHKPVAEPAPALRRANALG